MEFQEALAKALASNNGKLTMQQASELLHPAIRHRVMENLGAAQKSGICQLSVTRVGKEMVVSIVTPKVQTVPSGGDA